MNQERLINNMVLRWFDELRGIPRNREEVLSYVKFRVRRPCESDVERTLEYLETAGYLERCEVAAGDEALWKISAKGMQQIKKMVPKANLDPMIWEG